MQRRLQIVIGSAAVILFVIMFSIEAAHFTRLAAFFLGQLPTSDAQLFFSMGRAWLNGLHFYRDIFETKPPGIFLLAALAMRVGGGYPLYVWYQIILLALIGPMLAISAYKTLARSIGSVRWLVLAMSFLLGLTIAIASLYRTLGYEVEGFALLFATLPAVLFAIPVHPHRRIVIDLLAGISLGIAAMLKEPFVASALLALLVFCHSRNDAYRVLRILVIGGFVSIAILVLSGSFAGYFSLYLPEIFTGRTVSAIVYPDYGQRVEYVISAPLWLRTLNVYKLFVNLAIPTPTIFLPLFFGVCLCLWAPLRRHDLRPRAILISTAMIGTALVVGHQFFLLYELVSGLHSLGKQVPWGNPIILRLIALTLGTPATLLVVLAIVPRRFRPPWRMCAMAGVAILGMLMAGVLVSFGGDYAGQQYLVFAFPPFLALAVYCMNALASKGQYLLLGLLASLLILNAEMPGRIDDRSISASLRRSAAARPYQRAAVTLDALLTSCNEPRYFVTSIYLEPLPAFTVHSPYQITYGTLRALGAYSFDSTSYQPNPYLAAKLKDDLHNARIIVAGPSDNPNAQQAPDLLHSGSLTTQPAVITMDAVPGTPTSKIPLPIAAVMRDDFTTTPPPCARGHFPIPGLQIFFRRR